MADLLVAWETKEEFFAPKTVINGYTVALDGAAPVTAVGSPHLFAGGAGDAGTVHTAVVQLVDAAGAPLGASMSGNLTVPFPPVVGLVPATVTLTVA